MREEGCGVEEVREEKVTFAMELGDLVGGEDAFARRGAGVGIGHVERCVENE